MINLEAKAIPSYYLYDDLRFALVLIVLINVKVTKSSIKKRLLVDENDTKYFFI